MRANQRRNFLRLGARTVCGAGLALGASPWHTLARAAEGDLTQHQDYRALVCIYLDGGSDGFSLLVPTDTAEYDEYTASRQRLAIPKSELLSLSARNTDNPACELNVLASSVKTLYDEERLAFVANVGTLIEPTSKNQFESNSVALPTQLFSHSDQTIQWQQLQGPLTSRDGWGALAAQHLGASQERDYLTSVTLAGSNYWQTSETQRPYSIYPEGLVQYAGMDQPNSPWQTARREAFLRVAQQSQSHVFAQAYADVQNRAATITADLGAALSGTSMIQTPKPEGNPLVDQLAMVAQLISLRETLGMSRQIFFVNMTGWDVHDAQSREQPLLFVQLTQAMQYFQNAIDELGIDNSVTTFTASDFGRSLTSNGDGTDHGWGNHHMVMGGAVDGAEIFGSIPRMSVGGPDAVRNGRVVPTLSASQYAATLLRWIGLNEDAMDSVLPDLANFTERDLGFMRL